MGATTVDSSAVHRDPVALALGTEAFAQLAGSRSNSDFVKLVCRNEVGSAPSAGDLDDFIGLLNPAALSQVSLTLPACESDLNGLQVGLVGLRQTGIEFTLDGS